jgi:hypothetical protein
MMWSTSKRRCGSIAIDTEQYRQAWLSRALIMLRSAEVIRARWPAALFLHRIFWERVWTSASIVGVFSVMVDR